VSMSEMGSVIDMMLVTPGYASTPAAGA